MDKMTIVAFVDYYKQERLGYEPLGVGTTAVRNFIKEHRAELENEKTVKFTKKINSVGITIIDSEKLFERLT